MHLGNLSTFQVKLIAFKDLLNLGVFLDLLNKGGQYIPTGVTASKWHLSWRAIKSLERSQGHRIPLNLQSAKFVFKRVGQKNMLALKS